MKTLLKNALINNTKVNLLINNEIISYIGNSLPIADKIIDVSNYLLLPGMIDVHTHIRDLEQAYKETWITGSCSALKGGVTSIIDMPNTIPDTTNKQSLLKKMSKAEKSLVNYGFHLGATPNNINDINEILSGRYNRSIAGIKIFLASSSSNEVINNTQTIKDIFKTAKKHDKPVLVHTEMQDCILQYYNKYKDLKQLDVQHHNAIRNKECAIKGTELVLKITKEVGNTLYIAHVSTKEEVELIKEYKTNAGLNIFAEATPHHIFLNESIINEVGNFAKVNPPIRNESDRNAVWEGVIDGTIDTIGSDHAPHSISEKQKPYPNAPSGIPGLETTLPLMINEYLNNKISLSRIVELTSKNPSKIFKLHKRGLIKEGYYADLVIIDPTASHHIDAGNFQTKAKYSPFNGKQLAGKIITTIVNGNILYNDNDLYKNINGKELEYE